MPFLGEPGISNGAVNLISMKRRNRFMKMAIPEHLFASTKENFLLNFTGCSSFPGL
jgi:hypothetical protein